MRLNLVAACLLLFASGCATMGGIDEHVDFDLASQPTVYRDQWVRRSPPEVYVQPDGPAIQVPTVLFIPFRVTQQMQQPDIAGYGISRTIYQTWATMQLFPAMEFSSDDTPYRRDRALQLGRQRGADMVVGGFITYLYAGGTAGDSQVAVQIEGIDTYSGQVVWAIGQSGAMPASRTNDYLLFATKSRLPSDPIHAISKSLAIDTGKKIQNWLAPLPSSNTPKTLDEKINKAMFGDKDPVPAPRSYPATSSGSSF